MRNYPRPRRVSRVSWGLCGFEGQIFKSSPFAGQCVLRNRRVPETGDPAETKKGQSLINAK